MQVLETQSVSKPEFSSTSNKVTRIATYIATCALAVVGLIFIGAFLISPIFCHHFGECLFAIVFLGGTYGGIAVGIIFGIYATILLVSLCVRRCSQKPEIIYVNHAEFESGNFQEQAFSSSNPRDFVPPSRLYTAARIVMFIYVGFLAVIGLCYLGWMVYAVFACGFDLGCAWWSGLFVYIYVVGPAITIDTAIFTPLAAFLFLVSACARRPEIIYVQQGEFDQIYGVQQPLQTFGEQKYGPVSVNTKEYVTL